MPLSAVIGIFQINALVAVDGGEDVVANSDYLVGVPVFLIEPLLAAFLDEEATA